MNYLKRNPIITETGLEKMNYNNYIIKTPNYNSKEYIHYPCSCICHCHSRYHNLLENLSYSQFNYSNNTELYLKPKNNLYHQRNNSMYNLLISNNNNIIEDELKLKYNKNFNKKTIYDYKTKYDYDTDYNNNKSGLNKNYSYPNIRIKNDSNNENIIDNIYNNYNFRNIKVKNNINNSYNNNLEINDTNQSMILQKYNLSPSKSFEIKRKKLSKYYHTSKPKKYSYGDEIQTVNNKDNHLYKEIINTSGSKDNFQKRKIINFNGIKSSNNENNINDDKIKIEINEDIPNNNMKNHKFYNSRYKNYYNSPINMSRNMSYEPKKLESELKQRIIKETHNTRLLESKELKEPQTQKYFNDINDEINSNYNINNINNKIKTGLNINTNNYLYRNNNKYNINNLPTYNNINNNRNFDYNYYKINTYTNNNLKSLPKSYSLNNLNNYKYGISNNLKNNYKKQYDNNFSNNYNQDNHNNNNMDYEMIKLKVKLALLRKQMYEQERERIFNNEQMNIDYIKNKKYLEKFLSQENQQPRITNNNILLLKTKKLLEEKRLKNKQRELIKNMNYENKILNSLKRNLRTQNNDYNKNSIIKPKLKVWKP